MSAVLLDQTLAYVRSKFSKAEVKEVRAYGGEFSAAEIPVTSYVCPAIFVSVLGWSPEASGNRLRGRRVRAVSMAAFIAFKHANRELRMSGAMNLADRLSLALSAWAPDPGDAPFQLAPVDLDPVAENLYGRAVDKAGQALWMVRWTQDITAMADPVQLFDLLRIEITDNVVPGNLPPAPAATGPVPIVTEEINFPPLT